LKAELSQLQLRNSLGGEPGSKLIEQGQVDPDLVRQRIGAPIALFPQDVGQRFAFGQDRTAEHFCLHLFRTDLLQIHFHEHGLGVAVRLQHDGGQRVVALAQHMNGTEQIDGVVLAVHFPE
jgi:hypothetical protein